MSKGKRVMGPGGFTITLIEGWRPCASDFKPATDDQQSGRLLLEKVGHSGLLTIDAHRPERTLKLTMLDDFSCKPVVMGEFSGVAIEDDELSTHLPICWWLFCSRLVLRVGYASTQSHGQPDRRSLESLLSTLRAPVRPLARALSRLFER